MIIFMWVGESTRDIDMGMVSGLVSGLVSSRINGGVVILWNKTLDLLVNVIRVGVNWCIAIQFTYRDTG